jgi:hypothetical protein
MRFLRIEDGVWYEIQVLDVRNKLVNVRVNGYAHACSTTQGISLLASAEGDFTAVGLYLIPNRIDPRITARGPTNEWCSQERGRGTRDADITHRVAFYVDCDAVRPSGISATDDETRAAMRRAVQVWHELAGVLGDENALGYGFSGNGAQIHVALDMLPATEELERTIRGILVCLDILYSDDTVKIDITVSDAKRLAPAFGTTKRKGHSTQERPHRPTWFVCSDRVRPLDLTDVRIISERLRARLTPEQTVVLERALGVARDTAAGPRTERRARGESPFRRANAVPMDQVAEWLGLVDAGVVRCPGCSETRGVAILEGNLLKCHHARCASKGVPGHPGLRTNIDLVMETRGVARNDAVRLLAEHFGLERLRLRTVQNDGDEGDDRPIIEISTDEHGVNDRAVAALAARYDDIYQRGYELVRVIRLDAEDSADGVKRPAGSWRIAQLRTATLRERLSAAARWVTRSMEGLTAAHPPGWSVSAVHARQSWSGIRYLTGVIEAPALRADGTIIDTPGFDYATGLLLIPSDDFGSIPMSPTREDAIRGCGELLEVAADFPFEAPPHRSAWLAAVLTPFARPAIQGPAPLFLCDANTPGAGKGLLMDTAGQIALGRPLAVMAHVTEEEEIEKRITALVLAGDQVVKVDNIVGGFGGRTWDAALTALEWQGRRLGVSEIVRMPMTVTFYATGNNVEPQGDTIRRICHIRLSTTLERPENRDPSTFAHPSLLQWTAENRPRLVRAALSILRAYFVAGCPEQPVAWGSFEGWARIVAGAIVWCSLPDPCRTREVLDTSAGSVLSKLGSLMLQWEAALGSEGRTARQVLGLIAAEDRLLAQSGALDADEQYRGLREAIVELCPGQGGRLPSAGSLGKSLARYRDRVVGDRRFRSQADRRDVLVWRVEVVATAQASATTAAGDAGDAGDGSPHLENGAAGERGDAPREQADPCGAISGGPETSPASPASPASPLPADGMTEPAARGGDILPAPLVRYGSKPTALPPGTYSALPVWIGASAHRGLPVEGAAGGDAALGCFVSHGGTHYEIVLEIGNIPDAQNWARRLAWKERWQGGRCVGFEHWLRLELVDRDGVAAVTNISVDNDEAQMTAEEFASGFELLIRRDGLGSLFRPYMLG